VICLFENLREQKCRSCLLIKEKKGLGEVHEEPHATRQIGSELLFRSRRPGGTGGCFGSES